VKSEVGALSELKRSATKASGAEKGPAARAKPWDSVARNQASPSLPGVSLSNGRAPAQGARGHATYEKLISAAGELLGEVGFEKLTTNGICARAKLTPPALYRYFDDKYDVLEELARRLLQRQHDAYAIWLFRAAGAKGFDQLVALLTNWFEIAADIVASEPGGVWTMRAMRALPNLAHIRLESQRVFTRQMFEFYRRVYPDVPSELLWCRLRLRAEFGYTVDELAIEESELPKGILFREAARMTCRAMLDDGDPGPGSAPGR
jgi:AcrR family transcriptional regulator